MYPVYFPFELIQHFSSELQVSKTQILGIPQYNE